MIFHEECADCLMRQAREAPRRFTDDPVLLEQIEREATAAVGRFDRRRTPPQMGGVLNRIIADVLGVADPYLAEKQRLNGLALELLPELRRLVESAANPFAAAARLAIAGNLLDHGAPGGRIDALVTDVFTRVLEAPLGGDGAAGLTRLAARAASARSILYLADNAGEIVIDRLLVERLPAGRVTVAVRSGPAINDALVADAIAAGLGEVAAIVESGVALPGTPLTVCSPAFVERFRAADLIISKGQGNYETLEAEDAPVFFLLTAKCQVVARQLGCAVGEYLVVEGPRGR
jgi:uncharacterized protein with ATP-grasp and redox domains